MKTPGMVVLLVLSFLCASSSAVASDRVQLGKLRQQLIGHRVMLLPNADPHAWVQVKEKKGHYEYALFGASGTQLAGTQGIIKAVEEYDGLGDSPGTDSDDQLVDGFMVLVSLDNGQILACTTSMAGLRVDPYFTDVEVLAVHESKAKELAEVLGGHDLYLTSRSYLYDTGITQEQAVRAQFDHIAVNSASLTKFPRLTAVRLSGYEYIPKLDVLELKLSLPDGSIAVEIPQYNSVQKRWMTSIITNIPVSYTPKEVLAIQQGRFFDGMSKDALCDSIGLPDKINDYGRGGEQWVYGEGTYVYLDKDGFVVDAQSLE